MSDGGVRGCYGVCYRVSEAKGGGERGERWVGGGHAYIVDDRSLDRWSMAVTVG